jgi:hypothetical protein
LLLPRRPDFEVIHPPLSHSASWPSMINPKIVKKALRLLEAEEGSDQNFIRAQPQSNGSSLFFIHRTKSRVNTKLTANSIKVRIMMHVIAM